MWISANKKFRGGVKMKIKKIIAVAFAALAVCTVSTLLVVSTPTDTNATGDESADFSDVARDDWFFDDVQYVVQKGIMNGTGNNMFSPYEKTTRAMIVTSLWRLEGSPSENYSGFGDVSSDDYFCDAIAWAAVNHIVSGYSETEFAPNENATREQLAAVIYRYASFKKYDVSKSASLNTYLDRGMISDYAADAFGWAAANGIITGTSADMLSPQDLTERAQIAAILHRLCERFSSNTTSGAQIANSANAGANSKPSAGNSGGAADSADGSYADNPDSDGQPLISADYVFAKPGEEVAVAVAIKNNPGILGMTLTAYFDDEVLKLMRVENGAAVENVLELTPSKTLENGVRFLWDGVDLQDGDIRDGEILTMYFKVSDAAADGKYPITLKYFEDDVVDRNLTSISPQIKSGYISVAAN